MSTISIGQEIDSVSAELDCLSRKCERLAESLTGKPGPRSLKNKESAPSASSNSDYAAALRLYDEWYRLGNDRGNVCFERWLKQRLNSAKAPNCA